MYRRFIETNVADVARSAKGRISLMLLDVLARLSLRLETMRIWFLLVRPNLVGFIRDEMQVDRRGSHLQVLDAIRWHAAVHGVLPAELNDLSLSPRISDQVKKETTYFVESKDESTQTFRLVDPRDLGESRCLGLNVTVEFNQISGKRDKT